MTAPFPKPCGRLDWHEPHNWETRPVGANFPQRTYSCAGRVVLEGGYFADWDAQDDTAEDRADREKRETA